MLFDTNAISAWADEEPGLLAVLRNDRPWYLPSIALGEYRFGVLNSTRRPELERWLSDVESMCEVLSPDAETARHYAAVRVSLNVKSVTIPYHDIWIAALAIQHRLEIVTRDAHFDHIPEIRRVDWQQRFR